MIAYFLIRVIEDLIALPQSIAAGMENWGLLTFKESHMLLDPNEASSDTSQEIATIIGHEIAHQVGIVTGSASGLGRVQISGYSYRALRYRTSLAIPLATAVAVAVAANSDYAFYRLCLMHCFQFLHRVCLTFDLTQSQFDGWGAYSVN